MQNSLVVNPGFPSTQVYGEAEREGARVRLQPPGRVLRVFELDRACDAGRANAGRTAPSPAREDLGTGNRLGTSQGSPKGESGDTHTHVDSKAVSRKHMLSSQKQHRCTGKQHRTALNARCNLRTCASAYLAGRMKGRPCLRPGGGARSSAAFHSDVETKSPKRGGQDFWKSEKGGKVRLVDEKTPTSPKSFIPNKSFASSCAVGAGGRVPREFARPRKARTDSFRISASLPVSRFSWVALLVSCYLSDADSFVLCALRHVKDHHSLPNCL